MFKVRCICGETEKSFKNNIGSFFVNTCCEEKGYDEFGKLPEDYEKEAEEVASKILEESNTVFKEEFKVENVKVLPNSENLENLTTKELKDMCEKFELDYNKSDRKPKLVQKLKDIVIK